MTVTTIFGELLNDLEQKMETCCSLCCIYYLYLCAQECVILCNTQRPDLILDRVRGTVLKS